MQRKRYITLFFIFISMVMLVVQVIPHHHHNNGLICMKNDITPNCCGQQHTPDSEHCCCDTGCVTTHFFQQTPSPDNGWTHPDFPLVITLFSEPLLRLLVLPEESGQRQDSHVPQDFAHLRVFLLYRKVCNFIAGFYL